MQIEDDRGIEIPDSVVEGIGPWEELTVRDLVEATNQCLAADLGQPQAEVAVIAAIEKRCDVPGAADSGRGLVYAAVAGACSASYWSGER